MEKIGEVRIYFVFKHPKTGEEMSSKLYTPLELLDTDLSIINERTCVCDCKPVGETNVVECNCDDYYQDFQFHSYHVELAYPADKEQAAPTGTIAYTACAYTDPLKCGTYASLDGKDVFAVKPAAPIDPEALTVSDYEKVLSDHRRLVHELDVIINGDNAAKQASLVDMVCQIRDLWPRQGVGWVKASERLPNHRDNVIVRGYLNEQGYTDYRFVAFGHKAGSPGNEMMYFEFGSRSFLINDVEWLDEGQPQPGEVNAVAFAEWLNSNYISVENKDGVAVYVEYGPQEYHRKKQYKITELLEVYKKEARP